ncbi:MAG TPA: ester cyclase [Acidimicrobiales bacterium]|nr:ester cyclase [Acidimicrobiales bacterium]
MSDAARVHQDMLEAVTEQDIERFRALLHPDYTYTGNDGVELPGVDAGVAQVEIYVRAFPDLTFELRCQYAEGNASIMEFTARGTHKEELAGIPATGRQVTVPVCDIIEVRDGKVYREREYYDVMSMMQQLGVVPTS